MSYKDDQRIARAAQEPTVLEVHYGPNRQQKRSKLVDRQFTKKGYNFGRKIGGRFDNMIHHLAKVQGEQK